MDNVRIEHLLPILVFTLPGYVSIRVYDLFRMYRERPVPRLCVDAICYSALNFVVLAYPIQCWFGKLPSFVDEPGKATQALAGLHGSDFWLATIVFIFCPALWAMLAIGLGHTKWARRFGLVPVIPSAWDSMFVGRRGMFVRVRCDNGQLLAGLLGRNSSASAYPSVRELYLERQWRLKPDGSFDIEVEGTAGLYVSMDKVAWLEFLEIVEDQPQTRRCGWLACVLRRCKSSRARRQRRAMKRQVAPKAQEQT